MKQGIFGLVMLMAGWTQAQHRAEALFLGNSYTGVNDLPTIVRSLALAGGDTLLTDAHTPGGYTLQGHSTNATSLALIRAQAWDFVVLQEQSQLPSFPQGQVQQDVYPYAAQLNDSIQAHDSCAVTVFYMTWGRKHGDASNCGFWPPVCTYAGMQYELRRSYLNMAHQNEALVAPCGIAWWESIKRDSLLELYQPDESHPSYAGSYLNGCVFYATMYRRSPVGLNFYGGLDTATAAFLQQVAHDVVFDSLAQWRMWLDDALASFTYSIAPNGEATFTNTSLHASSYAWDFGDGGFSTVAQPTHVYASSGTYLVTLVATDGCTSDTLVDTVVAVVVGKPDPFEAILTVSPNPSGGVVYVQGSLPGDVANVVVVDVLGNVVHRSQWTGAKETFKWRLDLHALPKGVYFLSLEEPSGRVLTQKIVLQ